ncbi:MAG: multicopper oxidase domain-containing protein [Bacteroidota bacterium]|nr:multicopper oxidase domain-containing protein [Bacteroidota bacterium]MDP4236049.1 multicopper oxidase domain-containing protein [Bacteroidota bacterium]
MITRRTFLKRTAQAGIAAAAASKLNAFPTQIFGAPPVEMQEIRIPAVISGGDLTLAPSSFKIYPGVDTNLLLINNSFPAPTIRVKKGDTFAATIHNNLVDDSVLHWHGIHAPSSMGGHPRDAVSGGNSYSVSFPIIQRACTSFYHAHPHMTTGEQVYKGIAGFFIVEDDEEKALSLPSGEYDVPLMFTDKRFDTDHQLIYAPGNLDINSGWLGDTILVNGTPNAYLSVAPTLYRLRLVNGSNSRFYKIALSDGKSFTVIGNDGGFIDSPLTLTSAWLAPAERLDVLIDFSSYSQGQTVNLKSLKFTFSDGAGSGTVAQGAEMDLMQFQINKSGVSNGTIPSQLPAIEKYQAAGAPTRIWTFAAIHHINDQAYDINRIDAHVPFQQLEKWTFMSEAENTHPVHVHGAQFQVLDRNGGAPEPTEGGWKDIVRLDPQGTVNVLLKFTDYSGLFLIHCHKLEHADMGMMANFVIDSSSVTDGAGSEISTVQISPNPASDHAVFTFLPLAKAETLRISDTKGTVILEKSLTAGADKYSFDASLIPIGSYFVVLGDRKTTLTVMR